MDSGVVPVRYAVLLLVVALAFAWFASAFAPLIEAARDLERFQYARHRYITDFGQAPPADLGLQAFVRKSGDARWRGPYIDPLPAADPWGNPYVYIAPNENYPFGRILSYGADGKQGGSFFDADLYFYK